MPTISFSNPASVIMPSLQFKPREANNNNIAEQHVHTGSNNLICGLLFVHCVYFKAILSIAPVKACPGDCILSMR
jgi:hypothetical protein